jgi:hypothetical protein
MELRYVLGVNEAPLTWGSLELSVGQERLAVGTENVVTVTAKVHNRTIVQPLLILRIPTSTRNASLLLATPLESWEHQDRGKWLLLTKKLEAESEKFSFDLAITPTQKGPLHLGTLVRLAGSLLHPIRTEASVTSGDREVLVTNRSFIEYRGSVNLEVG